MNNRLAVAAALILALAGCSSVAPQTAVAVRPDPGPRIALACSGRVEGRGETVEVGAAADGIVTSIRVVEGQTVPRGALLAEIGCGDLTASLQETEAEAESARQSKLRLVRGSREEERLAAEQRTSAARAVLEETSVALRRAKTLAAQDDIPMASLDRAQRDSNVAQARLNEAIRNEELAKAPPLPEELARADAQIRAVEQRGQTIREKLAKCQVTAPIGGTVLRVLLKPGESFSTFTPRPLLEMADLTLRRVRAEVDERDVGKVRLGQRALVFPEGQRERTYAGSVQTLYKVMGRRHTLTGDPAEKADHDVLETMVLLDKSGNDLPVGLRVVVRFLEPETHPTGK
ncbi:MAG: efflux RND transporter periplasmic adaptor subunit [Bryobacteraceae bacterium]